MCDFDIERIPVKSTPKSTDDSIKELSTKLTDAENEIDILREDKYNLQEEYNKLVNKQYHQDYQIANQQESLKEIRKTLESLTIENRHLKGLVKLWIGEQ